MTILGDIIKLTIKLTGQPLSDKEQKLKKYLRGCTSAHSRSG